MICFYIDNYARYQFFKGLIGKRRNTIFICELPSAMSAIKDDGYAAVMFNDEMVLNDQSLTVWLWNGMHRYQPWFSANFTGALIYIEHANILGLYQLSSTGTNGRLGNIDRTKLANAYAIRPLPCPNILDGAERVFASAPFQVEGRDIYRRSYVEYYKDMPSTLIHRNRKLRLDIPTQYDTVLPRGKKILFLGQTATDTTVTYDAFTNPDVLIQRLLAQNNSVYIRLHPFDHRAVRYKNKKFSGLTIADNKQPLEECANDFDEIHTINSSAALKIRSIRKDVYLHGVSFAHAISNYNSAFLVNYQSLRKSI